MEQGSRIRVKRFRIQMTPNVRNRWQVQIGFPTLLIKADPVSFDATSIYFSLAPLLLVYNAHHIPCYLRSCNR